MIVLTGGGASTPQTDSDVRARAPLGNLTLLERPLRAATLLSAVQSALRARERQYEIRRSQQLLEAQVEDRTAALQVLSARLMQVQDEERRRLARELHDGLGQYLTAAKIHVALLAQRPGMPSGAVNEAETLLDRAIADTRTISHLLHPPLLDEIGFTSAAYWYVDGFGKRSGITTRLTVPSNLERLPSDTETALFRILQEALTNVHRHSNSPLVNVDLTCDESHVTLSVKDEGVGIPPQVLREFQNWRGNLGVGLAGIRERVKQLGGALTVTCEGPGTMVKAKIPVPERKKHGTTAA
jgi:signal transduction histidine kinase